MKNPEIRVFVVGSANGGKSTVVELIAERLADLGVPVEVKKIFDEEAPRRPATTTYRCLDALKERGITVKVEEVQSMRNLSEGIRKFYHVG